MFSPSQGLRRLRQNVREPRQSGSDHTKGVNFGSSWKHRLLRELGSSCVRLEAERLFGGMPTRLLAPLFETHNRWQSVDSLPSVPRHRLIKFFLAYANRAAPPATLTCDQHRYPA